MRGHAAVGIDTLEHGLDRTTQAFSEIRVGTQRGLAGSIEIAGERNFDEERLAGLDIAPGQCARDRQRVPVPESRGSL